MSCTPAPRPLRDLLATIATDSGIPLDELDREQLKIAVASGWVHEYRGRVGSTGAGPWRAAVKRRGGLLLGE